MFRSNHICGMTRVESPEFFSTLETVNNEIKYSLEVPFSHYLETKLVTLTKLKITDEHSSPQSQKAF